MSWPDEVTACGVRVERRAVSRDDPEPACAGVGDRGIGRDQRLVVAYEQIPERALPHTVELN